jgi:hypothetical protein
MPLRLSAPSSRLPLRVGVVIQENGFVCRGLRHRLQVYRRLRPSSGTGRCILGLARLVTNRGAPSSIRDTSDGRDYGPPDRGPRQRRSPTLKENPAPLSCSNSSRGVLRAARPVGASLSWPSVSARVPIARACSRLPDDQMARGRDPRARRSGAGSGTPPPIGPRASCPPASAGGFCQRQRVGSAFCWSGAKLAYPET